MRYTLFLHYPEMTAAELGDETFEAGKAAFHAYTKALEDAGVLASAEVLQPSTSSTTVALLSASQARWYPPSPLIARIFPFRSAVAANLTGSSA